MYRNPHEAVALPVDTALLCFADHVAACDTRRRELYCFACNDYNYDADFDNAMLVRQALLCVSWRCIILHEHTDHQARIA